MPVSMLPSAARSSCVAACCGLMLALPPDTASAQKPAVSPKSVIVANASEPVLCAEKDNVTLTLQNPEVTGFRIEAAHPVYLGSLQKDNWKADWTDCDFGPTAAASAPPKPAPPPTRMTLYEEPGHWLVGWRFAEFWRPATATFRVGDRIEKGLHLVQLWQIRPNGGEEVLVLYPQDGYWRARPLAPAGRDLTAFGSSFLIGPVEIDGRPLVKLTDIAYDPKARSFQLTPARGGRIQVTLAVVSAQRTVLDVRMAQAIGDKPFAALRSMYVTEFNNDVARVAVRRAEQRRWHESNIMTFKGAAVTDLWAGRTSPSRHNTSAPDMVFKAFR